MSVYDSDDAIFVPDIPVTPSNIGVPFNSNETDNSNDTDDIFNTIFKNNAYDCSKILDSYIYKCKSEKNKLVFFKEYIEHQLLVIIKLFNLNNGNSDSGNDIFKFKKFIAFLVILFILKSNDNYNDNDNDLLTELNKLFEKSNTTIYNYIDDKKNDSENFKYFLETLKLSITNNKYENTYDIVINKRNNDCISNLYNELIFNINNIQIQQNNSFTYIDLDDKDKIKIQNINFCIHNNFNLKKTNKNINININEYESYISSFSYLYLDNEKTPYFVQVSDNNIITLYMPIKVNETQLILNIHTKEVSNITNFIYNFIKGDSRPIEAKFETWCNKKYKLKEIYLPFEFFHYNFHQKDIIKKTFIIENEKNKYYPYIFKISNNDDTYEYFLKVFYIVDEKNEKKEIHNLFMSYNYSKLVVYNSTNKKIFVFNLNHESNNTIPLLYHHREKKYDIKKIIKFCNDNNNTINQNNNYEINEIVYYYDTIKIPEPTYNDPYFKENDSILMRESDLKNVSEFIDKEYNEFISKISDDYRNNQFINLTEKEKEKKRFYFHYNESIPETIQIYNMTFKKIEFLYEKVNYYGDLKKRYNLYNLYYCNDMKIYLVFVIFKKKYVGKFFTEIYLNDNYYYIDLNNKYIYNLNDFCRKFIIKYNNQNIIKIPPKQEYFIYHKDEFYYKGYIPTNINNTTTALKTARIQPVVDDKKKTNEYKEITIQTQDVNDKIQIDKNKVYIIELYPNIIMIFYNIKNKVNDRNTIIFISYNAKYLLFKQDDKEFLLLFDSIRADNIKYNSINSLDQFTIEFTKTNINEIKIKGHTVLPDSDTILKPNEKFDYLNMPNYSIFKDLFISNQKIMESFDGIILDDNYKKFYFDGYADIIFHKINEFNAKKCNNIYISDDTNIIYVYIKQDDSNYKINIYTKINKESLKYQLRNNVNKFNYDVEENDSLELKDIIQQYGVILNDDNIDDNIVTQAKKEFLSLYIDIKNEYNISYLTHHYAFENKHNNKIEIKYNDNNIYQIHNYFENKIINCYKIDKVIKYNDIGYKTNDRNRYNIYISLNAKLIYIVRHETGNETNKEYLIFYRDNKNPLQYYRYQNDGRKTIHNFEDAIEFDEIKFTDNIFKQNYYGNIYRESFKRRFVFRDGSDTSTTANLSDFFNYNPLFYSFLSNNINSMFRIIKRENNNFFQIQINNNKEDFLKITMFFKNINGNIVKIYDCNNIYIEKDGKYILLLNYKHDKPKIRCFQQNTANSNIYNLIKITNIGYNDDINDDYDVNTEDGLLTEYKFTDILTKFVIENSEYKYHFNINDLKSINFNVSSALVGQAGGSNDDQDSILYAIIIILINRILLLNKDEKSKLSNEITKFKF
jgi:hypothetical protein